MHFHRSRGAAPYAYRSPHTRCRGSFHAMRGMHRYGPPHHARGRHGPPPHHFHAFGEGVMLPHPPHRAHGPQGPPSPPSHHFCPADEDMMPPPPPHFDFCHRGPRHGRHFHGPPLPPHPMYGLEWCCPPSPAGPCPHGHEFMEPPPAPHWHYHHPHFHHTSAARPESAEVCHDLEPRRVHEEEGTQ
uniref:Uncharacterized protein n=1 Tax=Moniliophthora roreri TaxID=221103 RepID=A0A0W0FJ93_MONRR